MINITPAVSSSTFVVWPDSGTEIVGTETGSYSLTTTHVYDLTTATFPVERVNTPNSLSEMLVLRYTSGSGAPDKSGQYDFSLIEGESENYLWSNADVKFGQADWKWPNAGVSGSKTIDQGRLFINGVDDPTFTNYTTNNEEGAYTTYYN